jgi:DNA-binding transcriptional MerR regulator
MKREVKKKYTIGVVAEMYNIHPQTLRLYEKEGLIKPYRSKGRTRYYTEEDLKRLELVLTLSRELGVNLAGIEIILRMKGANGGDGKADPKTLGDHPKKAYGRKKVKRLRQSCSLAKVWWHAFRI